MRLCLREIQFISRVLVVCFKWQNFKICVMFCGCLGIVWWFYGLNKINGHEFISREATKYLFRSSIPHSPHHFTTDDKKIKRDFPRIIIRLFFAHSTEIIPKWWQLHVRPTNKEIRQIPIIHEQNCANCRIHFVFEIKILMIVSITHLA